MRTKLVATVAVTLALGLSIVGCDAADDPTQTPAETVTVTTMKQAPDGSWTTSSRQIPASAAKPPAVTGDLEVSQSALTISPCWHGSSIVLYSGTNYTGNLLCLEPDSSYAVISLGGFVAQSGYTVSPLYLYDSSGSTVFTNCTATYKASSAFYGSAVSARMASQNFGSCHF
jgi:hypothetical protein